jgi:hypothetical protein
MDARRTTLPRPPRVPALAEFPAVVEPALVDIDEPPDSGIQGYELIWSRPSPPPETLLDAATEVGLADERVRRLLADKRYAVLGSSTLLDRKDGPPAALMMVYSYSDEQTYRIRLEVRDGEVLVDDVEALDEQPPASDEEIERAVGIAREAADVRPHLAADYAAMALLTSSVQQGDEHYGRRRVVVSFGPADERLPRVRALVDLGAEEVLSVSTRSDRRAGD